MSLVDELQKLSDMHRSGVLTGDEFACAKARLLSPDTAAEEMQSGANGLATDHHLRQIRAQNEIARLDREWELERENYLWADRNGSRQIPSVGTALAMMVVSALFGVFWIAMVSSTNGPPIMSAAGVLIIVVGLGVGINIIGKASAYEQAESAYQTQRQKLLASSDMPSAER